MFNLNKFNLQKSLFKLVVLLLPTQLVFHFWPAWSIVRGIRVDYFSPSIYLVDIFVILYLVTHLRGASENIKFTNKKLLTVVCLIFINLVVSPLFANSAIYLLRVVVYFLFAFLVAKSKINYYHDFIKTLLFSVFFICTLSIFQFGLQRSLGGPIYFLGEREISTSSLAAPLFNLFGKEYLRVQSTFSHPNSFAGFVLISLVLFGFTNFPKKDKKLRFLVFVLAIPALLFSFSQGAFVSIFFIGLLIMIAKHSKFLLNKLFSVLPSVFVCISLLLLLASPNLTKRGGVYSESVSLRIELAGAAKDIVAKNLLFGVGANNFIFELSKNPPIVKSILFLQPVHNLYLLIFSEWGLVGLFLFVFLVNRILLNSSTNLGLSIGLATVLFLGLFDHYFLTLNQNMFLFIIVLTFAMNSVSTKNI